MKAGVREVVVFHSTASELMKYEGHLPFDIIADPNKRLYRELGVESSWQALTDPRVWLIILWAVVRSLWRIVRHGAPIPPLLPGGGRFGLTADLLIDRDGRILAARYGVHAGDHWSVDDLLFLVARTRGGARTEERESRKPRTHAALEKAATRLARTAYAVLTLTTLHHVYGALRYQTPFRLHVAVIAGIVAVAIAIAHRLFLRRQSLPGLIALGAATLIFPVVGIGVFEGAYNHVAKNVLYFMGTAEHLLTTLFPPPTYELPNDVFFEITGVLQVLPAALTAYAFALLLERWRSRDELSPLRVASTRRKED